MVNNARVYYFLQFKTVTIQIKRSTTLQTFPKLIIDYDKGADNKI